MLNLAALMGAELGRIKQIDFRYSTEALSERGGKLNGIVTDRVFSS